MAAGRRLHRARSRNLKRIFSCFRSNTSMNCAQWLRLIWNLIKYTLREFLYWIWTIIRKRSTKWRFNDNQRCSYATRSLKRNHHWCSSFWYEFYEFCGSLKKKTVSNFLKNKNLENRSNWIWTNKLKIIRCLHDRISKMITRYF